MSQNHLPNAARVARGLLASLVLVVVAEGAGPEPPVTTSDILLFLESGIAEGLVLSEIRDRGFDGRLDPTRETQLRKAGASETLIVAVRRSTPPETARTAPLPSLALAPNRLPRDPRTTFPVRARSVRVPVAVLDKAGQPVIGLPSEAFRVSENGKRQKVTLFSSERQPLRVALALDVSGSMHSKIRRVEEALRYFIDLLEPADEILAITFADRARVVQDFTADREVLAGALDGLEPGGSTALYDAAFVAIKRVAAGPAESKAVVLVSDGIDTVSTTTFDELREFALQSEVPVFAIGLDAGDEPRPVARRPTSSEPGSGLPGLPGGFGRGGGRGWPGPSGGWGLPRGARKGFDGRPLTELADETGGQALILKSLQLSAAGNGGDRLKKAVETIAMTLRHRYLLGYEPPEGQYGWRTIRVDVQKPATARARKGYYGGA